MKTTGDRWRASALVMALALSSRATFAQSVGIASDRDLPPWMERWSALAPQGDLARRPTSASVALPLLIAPTTRVGSFWSAGNPGALPFELRDRFNMLSASRAMQDGAYRRPLDAASSTTTQVSGLAWQPLETRGAVVGRVVAHRSLDDPSSASAVNAPYGSSPFVVTDTTAPAMRRDRVRLDGAGGWRLGEWGIGAALGYEARRSASTDAPFARSNRAVREGANVGLTRRLRDGALVVGARAGWMAGEETISLSELPEQGAVFALEGYREVPRLDVSTSYYRRISRDVRSAGVDVGGALGGIRWVLYGTGARLRDRLTSERVDEPRSDRWSARTLTSGVAIQRGVAHGRAMVTAEGSVASLTGDAVQVLTSRSGPVADERVIDGSVEVRVLPATSWWTGVVRLSVLSEQRERSDSASQARSTVDGLTPGIAVEFGGRVSSRLRLSAGYAQAWYSGSGVIPSPSTRGALYRRVFAPELDMATSSASARAGSVVVQWSPSAGTDVWITGRDERTSSANRNRPFAPSGNRAARSVWLGVTRRP